MKNIDLDLMERVIATSNKVLMVSITAFAIMAIMLVFAASWHDWRYSMLLDRVAALEENLQ